MKNNEMPSTPIKKFIFDEGIHKNSSTNWNLAVDLSKRIHRKVDKKKVNIEKDNATFRILSKWLSLVNTKTVAPTYGSIIRIESKIKFGVLPTHSVIFSCVISGTKLREYIIHRISGNKRIVESLWYNQCFFPCKTFSNDINSPVAYSIANKAKL